ncbi:hypothetical protein BJV78DRAFT_1266702 [Lactifluus subvellereus]|nr:hypothetical protein BJV78DRAFT_1266702 [Lactifluus subvellereus]
MGGLRRALSPTPLAAALATDSGFARALETASTVDEVVAAIPVRYRDAIGPIAREIADACHRAASSRKQLATLELALTTGEHPPQVIGSLKVPDLQLMQEFRLANPEIIAIHEEATKNEIRDARTKLSEAVKSVTKVLVNNHPVRAIAQVIHSDGTSSDVLRTSASATELRYRPMENHVIAMMPALIDTTCAIVEGRHQRAAATAASKKKLREQATDAMAVDSAPVAGPSNPVNPVDLRKMLREELQKELNKSSKKGKKSARKARSGDKPDKKEKGPDRGPKPKKGKGKSRK